MKNAKQTPSVVFVSLVMGFLLLLPLQGWARDGRPGPYPRGGVYIGLTQDFYEALRDEGRQGSRVYTNSVGQEHLRDISVSARFMVESNLQIIRQQERIIELLESILEKQK